MLTKIIHEIKGFDTYLDTLLSDINECQLNNGGCQHVCTNNPGSYSCSCPQGYRISSDRKSCEDINECHLRNGHGPCQDTCENTPGSYKCGCSNLNGTRLAPDLHTCADVNECTEGNKNKFLVFNSPQYNKFYRSLL